MTAEAIIDAIVTKLSAVVAGGEYENTISHVEEAPYNVSNDDLDDGVTAVVAYAGQTIADQSPHTQLDELSVLVEAHKRLTSQNAQREAMKLEQDIRRAVLKDKNYLAGLARIDRVFAESSGIESSDSGAVVIAMVTFRIPHVQRHNSL
ncbi:hypothetical protein HCH_02902 [Hahella chejuensis KCTC 2396]|uniref:Uncharacterized protein n=1 Tax=Hahella chejuensis (strain KCTC 2396) TaxID=349521 RepID=Q2SI48_HAHCH|nr:bacteriocin immunity protein [Hahella chejuensis]ABC29676.1 hypothetical protein HCH_02902 [Hahella chejuensis KCTC 2396]